MFASPVLEGEHCNPSNLDTFLSLLSVETSVGFCKSSHVSCPLQDQGFTLLTECVRIDAPDSKLWFWVKVSWHESNCAFGTLCRSNFASTMFCWWWFHHSLKQTKTRAKTEPSLPCCIKVRSEAKSKFSRIKVSANPGGRIVVQK